MENSEYNQRTNPMVKFLMGIFSKDINLCARTVNAQAEQNTKYLIDSLKVISNMICKWIEELKKIEKENESK